MQDSEEKGTSLHLSPSSIASLFDLMPSSVTGSNLRAETAIEMAVNAFMSFQARTPSNVCEWSPTVHPSHLIFSLIARLMEENERLQAGKAELEKRLSDVIASSSSHHTVMNPTLLQPMMEAPAKSLPIPSSFAELIVTQVMNAQVDTGNAVQSLVASVAQQIGMPLREVMDRPGSSPLVYAFEFPTLASLPDRDLADAMVERYFACGNCYQPLLDPETVRQE